MLAPCGEIPSTVYFHRRFSCRLRSPLRRILPPPMTPALVRNFPAQNFTPYTARYRVSYGLHRIHRTVFLLLASLWVRIVVCSRLIFLVFKPLLA